MNGLLYDASEMMTYRANDFQHIDLAFRFEAAWDAMQENRRTRRCAMHSPQGWVGRCNSIARDRPRLMTIITFPDRNAPDPNCTSGDKHRYSMAYTLGDSEYSFDIWARSMQDAEAHCAAIRSGVEVCGQLVRVEGDG